MCSLFHIFISFNSSSYIPIKIKQIRKYQYFKITLLFQLLIHTFILNLTSSCLAFSQYLSLTILNCVRVLNSVLRRDLPAMRFLYYFLIFLVLC